MNHEQPGSGPENPLMFFFSQLPQEEQDMFDGEILNRKGISVEALEHIKDTEEARRIMGRFRKYLEMSKNASQHDLKVEAGDLADYIDKKIEESLG